MKPTEADIQAELIEGWEIDEVYYRNDEFRYALIHDEESCINIYGPESCNDIDFSCHSDYVNGVELSDFLTGNYNLSEISQHYDPEEWQRIITMCESIVRLITGEQVEQTLEEKVREKLEPLGPNIDIVSCSQSCVEIKGTTTRFKVFHDRIEATYRGNPETETIAEYQENTSHMCEWRKALPAIAALLTEQPEQTLKEAVNDEIAAIVEADKGIESFELDKSGVLLLTKNDAGLKGQKYEFAITPRSVNCRISSGPWKYQTLLDYLCEHPSEEWTRTVLRLAREVQRQTQSPSYSDLEQRVEELEEDKRQLIKDCQNWKDRYEDSFQTGKAWHRESVAKSGVIDTLKEQRDKATATITDLEAQLQDYISPADHEAEISKWRTAFEALNEGYKSQCDDAQFYMEAFHREYAKNAEASK